MLPSYGNIKLENCPKIKNKFIIHEHHAVRAGLHFDLRIEYGCILESWASRKIPELIDGSKKKIAIFKQPDHDPEWFDFSGNIDDGYGKGKVIIFDKGDYKLIKRDKYITIDFYGTKLKGRFTLFPYKGEQWLMFRSK